VSLLMENDVTETSKPSPTVIIPLPSETTTPTTEPVVTLVPTPTAIPPVKRTWGNYPGPSIWPPVEIPPPASILPKPDDQVNILLLGDDQRPNEYTFRTDSIIILTLNSKQSSASMTSFPRDLYIYAPGWTMQRINVVFARGGFDLMSTTFEYNFGVKLDYYAKINVFTFLKMIDSLGGIDVAVAYPMTDDDAYLGKKRTVPAGNIHMNGEMAAWYVRSRYSTSDFDRARRQQEVLQAILNRLLHPSTLEHAPDVYNTLRNSVTTNLTLENVASWIPLALQIKKNNRLRQYMIGRAQTTDFTVPTDSSKVLLPKYEAILGIMRQAVTP